MAFTIIKKGQAPQKATQPPKKKAAPKPQVRKKDELIWGPVGRKHHKDGHVETLYSMVPRSEASPWLLEYHEQQLRKKGS